MPYSQPDIPPSQVLRQLWRLLGANMQSTSDQAFEKLADFTNWGPAKVMVMRKTGTFSVSCLGGVYTGAGKTGVQIVSSLQSYASLVGLGSSLSAVLNAEGVQTAAPILSLTTGNTGALTADVIIYGMILD